MIGYALVCYLVAAILFVLAALPPLGPYGTPLARVGLAFFAVGHML